MGQALGNVLPIAVAIAIFPVPIMAIVLLLASERGRAKGVAFVLAWTAGLSAVCAVALVLAGAVDATDAGEPATWVNALLLGLGLVALGAAAKQVRGRSSAGDDAAGPGWMRAVDSFTTAKAGAAGFGLAAINPKNLLLTVAAAVEIAEVGLPAGQQVASLIVFVVIASVGVSSPLVAALALGERSRQPLDALRGWMARHNATIMAVLMLLIGAKLIGDAVSGFS